MYNLSKYSTKCVQCQSINNCFLIYFMVHIGKKLKELRISENLTQQQIAEILNISRVNYTRYETNASRPDYETLIAIADFFKISLDEIFGRDI